MTHLPLRAVAAILAALTLPASAKTYYVDAATGNDANTGLKASSAFKTIQRAVNKAPKGSTILVEPGVYGRFSTNNKKLTIKAVDGRDWTFLDGGCDESEAWDVDPVADMAAWGTRKHEWWDVGSRYVRIGNDTFRGRIGGVNTKLAGFTIRNANWAASGGSLSACRITNVHCAAAENSTLVDTEIEGNDASDPQAKPFDFGGIRPGGHDRYLAADTSGSFLYGCTLSRCVVRGNSFKDALTDGWQRDFVAEIDPKWKRTTLKNCLIAGNRGGAWLVRNANVYNCTIVGNTCFYRLEEWSFVNDDGELVTKPASVERGFAVAASDVYDSIIAGNVDADGEPANVEIGTDNETGAFYANGYMNDHNHEATGDVWELSKAEFTMMHSRVEDFPVWQTGNKGKVYAFHGYWRYVLQNAKNSTGNSCGDPLFLDADGGDYRLAPWSPCVNAGADYVKTTGTKDLAGLARKVRGKVDMGAYELPAAKPVPADYDGDGRMDAALYFPATSEWWIWQSRGGLRRETFGEKGAVPCPADYDGDGRADPAVYTAAAKKPEFGWLDADGCSEWTRFGTKGAVPVPRRDAPGLPAVFGVYTSNAKKPAFSFLDGVSVRIGAKGARPVAADFDGDGADDLAVYSAASSRPAFAILPASADFDPAARMTVAVGPKGSAPAVADYDGDGAADPAAYSGSAKVPALRFVSSESWWTETRTLPIGRKGSLPAGGDWDGDGVADPAFFDGTDFVWIGENGMEWCAGWEWQFNGGFSSVLKYATVFLETDGGAGGPRVLPAWSGDMVRLPDAPPVRAGYSFDHWEDGSGNRYDPGAYVDPCGLDGSTETVLRAVWNPGRYFVRFDGNGADAGSMDGMECTYGDWYELPPNGFVRDGYGFEGWTLGRREFWDEAWFSNLTPFDGETVVLSARWAPLSYTICFSGNGATSGRMSDREMLYGEWKALPANAFKRTGYRFAGWEDEDTGEFFANREVVGNLRTGHRDCVWLDAVWDPIAYTVKFAANGGRGSTPSVVARYGEETVLPACGFTRSGYVFDGWAKTATSAARWQAGDEAVLNLSSKAGATVTLYAKWAKASARQQWYVDADCGRDGASGTSWDDPLASIQEALDRAVAGNTIHVAPGVYGPISCKKAVTVESERGADETFIDGFECDRCATLGEKTKLVGFTLRNGYASDTAGVEGGVLSYCVIRDCYATDSVGAASDCTIEDSLVCENRAYNTIGGLASCTVRRSVVRNNGSYHGRNNQITGGRFEDCLVEGAGYNGESTYSSGAGYTSFYNCTVLGQSVHDVDFYNCVFSTRNKSTDYIYLVDHSCYWGTLPDVTTWGTGNIRVNSAADVFADADGGDYHLRETSPAVDAGKNANAPDGPDLDGNDRCADGRVDMGCYEYQWW